LNAEPRIDHLRKALVDIEDTQVIKAETVNNVREAVRLSELDSTAKF
jgi:hypothetical protein